VNDSRSRSTPQHKPHQGGTQRSAAWSNAHYGVLSCYGLCALFLFIFATSVQATPAYALELKWGLSLSDFRQLNFDIEEEWSIWHRATAVRLGEQAQRLTNAGSLILVFDEEFGLVKTQWAGYPIERDATGAKGIKRFGRLKTTITRQYGVPKETHEEPSVRLQGFHGNFYQCLQNETCGKWETIWETTEGGVLILKLVGLDAGVGFIQLTHQGPNLKDILRRAHRKLGSKEHEI